MLHWGSDKMFDGISNNSAKTNGAQRVILIRRTSSFNGTTHTRTTGRVRSNSTPSVQSASDETNEKWQSSLHSQRRLCCDSSPTTNISTAKKDNVKYTVVPLQYADRTASAEYLAYLKTTHPLPPARLPGWVNFFRYRVFSVYRRLFAVVLLFNVIAIIIFMVYGSREPLTHHVRSLAYREASTAVAANLFVATLTRHEHFVNLIFRIATSLPHRTPLVIRKHAAKVYCYGGVHSGSGVAALIWYILFAVLALKHFAESFEVLIAIGITATLISCLLLLMIVGSLACIRIRYHDTWELSHRYAGWSIVATAWAQLCVLVYAESSKSDIHFTAVLVRTPLLYFLVAITCLIVYPWLRMRKRTFKAEQLSSHAMRLHFSYRNVPMGAAVRLADSPLLENHAFAVIPRGDGSRGYSVIISNAGDWTNDFINSGHTPTKVWMRGLPARGILHVSRLFQPIIIVATGSGIGPCLSFLQTHTSWPMRVIWSARSPEITYGSSIMEAVLKSDKDAILIDTNETGYPDLPALIYSQYKQISAEAVVMISNQRVTEKVVYALETRNVPVFGAIFDS